jgi:hypothetical protein
MLELKRFTLPRVGVQYELTTKNGTRVRILSHHSILREILVQDSNDDAFPACYGSYKKSGRIDNRRP